MLELDWVLCTALSKDSAPRVGRLGKISAHFLSLS